MAVNINLQIIQDNVAGSNVKVMEFTNEAVTILSGTIKEVSHMVPELNVEVRSVSANLDVDLLEKHPSVMDADVFIVHNFFGNEKVSKF